ncbi:hypothetical protein [Companilactobacillus pabuli]|uniref:DUF4145 domain-containing protein n=1 Tax=Companilactobacillus pabuli TaxID=2714036 RepID=A0A7L7KZ13_9LACO|nr:hypothetical protein [Companilactobacillus pabuli]QMT84244.1 hypothetical protein G6534_06215 [Companilactobacillus pabuli]
MDLSTNDGKLEFLKVLKDKYEQRAKYIDPSEEQNIFSWKSQKLHFNVILTHTSSDNDIVQGIIFFAEPSTTGKDELTYLDLYKKTKNFEYDSLYDVKDNLKYLIKNNLIRTPTLVESSLMKELIARFNLKDSDISKYATNFADNEYKLSKKSLSENLFSQTNLNFVKSKYFTDRYHFNEIKSNINDDQFTYELEDCLKAYESGMWFVASTGIGSVIEHLLYLTIANLDKTWTPSEANPQRPLRQLGKGPTKTNYINALSKCLPRFDDRQRSQLEAMFLLRNSVDHFNSGYSNKGLCDTLLQGIVDIYNGIYLQSV